MQQGTYVFSVNELTRYIKTTLERERSLQGVMVRGEISNCKYHTSGHFYFTLKDENSQLPCVMWRDRVQAQGFRCENGQKVIAEGSIGVYERGGYYQLNAYSLQADGVGNLYLAFEQLKRKLEEEGLFAQGRKRALPAIPRCIALLTSPTGAVVHDFVTVSSRRWRGRHIVLVPTAVQGPQAPESIVRSLALATHIPCVDVIVVARGGGSFEELSCFNSESVARAIAASPIPVVSAVGHETDFTIADFVADLRAATPSAAAELAVPDLQGVAEYLRGMEQRILSRACGVVATAKRDINRLASHPSIRNPRVLLQERQQSLDILTERIFDRMRGRMITAEHRLEKAEGRITALDPHGILQRGFAFVTRPHDGSLVATAVSAQEESLLDIRFADGSVQVHVDAGIAH